MRILGLLCTAALAAGFAIRYQRLRPCLDARARRSFLGKAGVFLGLSGAAASLLTASAGAFPLPFAWTLLAALTAAALLLGMLKRP